MQCSTLLENENTAEVSQGPDGCTCLIDQIFVSVNKMPATAPLCLQNCLYRFWASEPLCRTSIHLPTVAQGAHPTWNFVDWSKKSANISVCRALSKPEATSCCNLVEFCGV